jgi:peptidoglycan/LPS O-acetylase OafA/YrhL
VTLQRLKASTNPLIEGKGLYWVVIFVLFTYLVPHSTFYTIFSLLLLGILTISLAYTLPGIATRLLKGNDISYGVYIYHGLIVNIFVQIGLTGHYKYLPMIMAITYVLAFASWKLIEKPMLKRKKKTINLQLKEDIEPNFDAKLKAV